MRDNGTSHHGQSVEVTESQASDSVCLGDLKERNK